MPKLLLGILMFLSPVLALAQSSPMSSLYEPGDHHRRQAASVCGGPRGALENMQREENTTATTVILLLIYVHACRAETIDGDSTVAGDGGLDSQEGRSFVRDRPITTTIHISVETS